MQVKPEAIQSVTAETWTRREHLAEPSRIIEPVRKKDAAQGPNRDDTEEHVKLASEFLNKQPEAAEALVSEVQSHLEDLNIQLQFQVDDRTGEYVVKVTDSESGEVIRQIPPEELVELRGKLEELRGILFDKKA